ncbi:26S proteasome non-ATPase regulatory subunit 13, partial [Phytophthora pseudosyringae]
MSVRRYLSEPGEKEALRVLKEQLRHQTRVTSDDVRLAVRAVASQGGAVPLPPAFPPSRWVLEFKRVHGFAQFNSFALGAPAALGLPERLEVPPLRSAVAGGSSQRDTSS